MSRVCVCMCVRARALPVHRAVLITMSNPSQRVCCVFSSHPEVGHLHLLQSAPHVRGPECSGSITDLAHKEQSADYLMKLVKTFNYLNASSPGTGQQPPFQKACHSRPNKSQTHSASLKQVELGTRLFDTNSLLINPPHHVRCPQLPVETQPQSCNAAPSAQKNPSPI